MKKYQALSIFFVVLLISSFAATDAFASIINIIDINLQGLRGIRTEVYFESANASYANAPITVNTANTVPTTSSSYRISPGKSVYLWSPQFSTAKSLPASKMTLDIWAASTPEINGNASSSFRDIQGSVSLTTTQSNDLIYAVVTIDSTFWNASISGGGLTWHTRAYSLANTGIVYTYWTVASSPLSAATITASLNTSRSQDRQYCTLTVFAVSGIDTTNPFGSTSSTPMTNYGDSNTCSVRFSTSTKNCFLIGALYINGIPKSSIIGPGFTEISALSSGKGTGVGEYQNAANPGDHIVSFALGTTENSWSMIGDALVPATSGAIIKVSAYAVTSTGTIQNELFTNQNANPTAQEGGQVATTFSTAPATVPALGYIQVILTAPTSSTLIISWGNGQPTNIQLCTAYSSPV